MRYAERGTSICSSSKESVDFRKHRFDGFMIFFRNVFELGNITEISGDYTD